MSFYEKGPVRIHYEEAGSGFPLLLIAGGGLNSTIAGLHRGDPFNPIEEFKGEYRCIAADLRNANGGQSSGPLEIDRPWDAYTDDQLGLMDHLGIDKFMVMGFCIGGPFIWNLLEARARIASSPPCWRSRAARVPRCATSSTRTTSRAGARRWSRAGPTSRWTMVDKFLTKMYRTNADFVFTVTRDFVRNCQTPVLILPDDIPAHPYAVAMEAAMLAPKARGEHVSRGRSRRSGFPWRCARSVRSFGRIGRRRERWCSAEHFTG